MWKGRVRRWLKRILFPLVALVIGLCIGLTLLEVALRVRPQMFSIRFQNLAFSKYDVLPDGIYVAFPGIPMHLMRSNFRTDFCFSGHCWEHVSDRFGFRNPPELDQKEVLLLGDSMIYGHGVEEEQTVAHVLRSEYGHATYNMAQQGNCLYDHYTRFRMYSEEFRPRTVLVFVFLNDFQDLETRRRRVERNELPEIEDFDYEVMRSRAQVFQARRAPWLSRTLFRLHSIRLMTQVFRHLDEILARIEITRNAEAAPRGNDPYFIDCILDPDRFQPLAEYYERILPDFDRRCRAQGARLVLINLELHKPNRSDRYRRAQREVRELLRSLSTRYEIAMIETGDLFRDDWARAYLVRDGHLSAYGNRQLADLVHREVLGPASITVEGGAQH